MFIYGDTSSRNHSVGSSLPESHGPGAFQNRRAYGRELRSRTRVVVEDRDLIRMRATLDLACNKVLHFLDRVPGLDAVSARLPRRRATGRAARPLWNGPRRDRRGGWFRRRSRGACCWRRNLRWRLTYIPFSTQCPSKTGSHAAVAAWMKSLPSTALVEESTGSIGTIQLSRSSGGKTRAQCSWLGL